MLVRALALSVMMIVAVPASASVGHQMLRQCKLVFDGESVDDKSLDTEKQLVFSWVEGYRKGTCLGYTAGAIEAVRTVDANGLCLPETVMVENAVIRMLLLFGRHEKDDLPSTFYEIVRKTLVDMYACEK